jgi:hypothetical protein
MGGAASERSWGMKATWFPTSPPSRDSVPRALQDGFTRGLPAAVPHAELKVPVNLTFNLRCPRHGPPPHGTTDV